MVELFSININESIEMNNIHYLMRFISQNKAKKAMRFYKIQDSYRSVLGEILARYAICYRSGCSNEKIEISIDANGKPKLVFSTEKLFFNISHSGDWVVCAIANNSVGVDVECMKNAKLQIARRFFSRMECEFLLKHNSEEEQKQWFYTIWTLKESYVKADGRGLLVPLHSFSIIFKEQMITVDTENDLTKCCFKTFQINDQYIAAVCSVEEPINSNIEKLNISDVVKLLQS
jgi:4'-phosphopantetheinyl transferase